MSQPILHNQTALLTGASRGIGRAIAEALIRDGVSLTLLSRTRPPFDCQHIACDLGDPDAISRALEQLSTPPDFLINNAGLFLEKPIPDITLADWEQIQRVNVTAPFLLIRGVLPGMIARGRGRIINVASTASAQGYLHQAAYCASKHALLGLARSLALEAKPHGIHVHTICPGGVDTELIKGTQLADRLRGQPMIQPADIAAIVVFLLQQPAHLDLPELIVRRF